MGKKLNILIIDDEPDILDLMSDEFKFNGHNVDIASSGNEAVDILKSKQFDVVVSDFKMPNGNGMVVLKFVNTLSPRPNFYFVSGQSDVSIEECLKAGAKEFFSKPFDVDNLVRVIERTS